MPTLYVDKGEGCYCCGSKSKIARPWQTRGGGRQATNGARQWTTQHTAALSKSHWGRQECHRWGRPGTSGHQECSSAWFGNRARGDYSSGGMVPPLANAGHVVRRNHVGEQPALGARLPTQKGLGGGAPAPARRQALFGGWGVGGDTRGGPGPGGAAAAVAAAAVGAGPPNWCGQPGGSRSASVLVGSLRGLVPCAGKAARETGCRKNYNGPLAGARGAAAARCWLS